MRAPVLFSVRSTSCVLLLVALTTAGCASHATVATPADVVRRTGVPARPPDATGTVIPPGVAIDDGLTPDEAVAIALWNNPDFQVQLANLGFARADLVEAGLLQNPVLALLFPWGPKQLEATVRWPIEALWQRPKRIAAATLSAQSIAAGLEQDGLTLVSDVKLAYAEYALAQDRVTLAERALTELNAMAGLMDSRFQAGDVSQLEARTGGHRCGAGPAGGRAREARRRRSRPRAPRAPGSRARCRHGARPCRRAPPPDARSLPRC